MGTMPWAYDLTSFHFGLSQRLAVVCATVFYRVNFRAAAYDNDRDAVDLGGEGAVSLTDSLPPTSIHSEVTLLSNSEHAGLQARGLGHHGLVPGRIERQRDKLPRERWESALLCLSHLPPAHRPSRSPVR